MNKLKKNFIYNIAYQVLALIVPLILSPYLSRKLGATGIGTYSYTYSIVYYFMLLCLLGVNNYGNREIAKYQNDKEQLSKTFWEIYLFQLFMGIIMAVSYLIFLNFFEVNYKTIAILQIFFIFSAMFDINWLFFGLEEFKKTVTRNTLIRILSVILIFVFVKEPTDIWKYTLIMSLTNLSSQIILWLYVPKYIKRTKVELKGILKHIKPNLILFIPVVAVSLYKIMDKIMLGIITDVTEVGYYENAEKLVHIPLTFITALGTVMLPRITNMLSNGDEEKVKEYISKSIKFVMFLSFAMCFGLMVISENFAVLYFGEDFAKTGSLIALLSITLPFLSFANVLRTQYLIPREKDKEYIISVCLGAVVNLVVNLILIGKYKSVGACIGTILAEFMVMFYQMICIRKELPIKKYLVEIIPFLLSSLIMYIVIRSFNYLNLNKIIILCLQVAVGATIYLLLNWKYIFTTINIKKVIRKFKKEKKTV